MYALKNGLLNDINQNDLVKVWDHDKNEAVVRKFVGFTKTNHIIVTQHLEDFTTNDEILMQVFEHYERIGEIIKISLYDLISFYCKMKNLEICQIQLIKATGKMDYRFDTHL